MGLGNTIRLHDKTYHGIGHHFIQEEIGQCHARQLVPGARMVKVGKKYSLGTGKPQMRFAGM